MGAGDGVQTRRERQPRHPPEDRLETLREHHEGVAPPIDRPQAQPGKEAPQEARGPPRGGDAAVVVRDVVEHGDEPDVQPAPGPPQEARHAPRQTPLVHHHPHLPRQEERAQRLRVLRRGRGKGKRLHHDLRRKPLQQRPAIEVERHDRHPPPPCREGVRQRHRHALHPADAPNAQQEQHAPPSLFRLIGRNHKTRSFSHPSTRPCEALAWYVKRSVPNLARPPNTLPMQ